MLLMPGLSLQRRGMNYQHSRSDNGRFVQSGIAATALLTRTHQLGLYGPCRHKCL